MTNKLTHGSKINTASGIPSEVAPLSFDYKAKTPNAVTQAAIQELIANRQSRHLPEYDDESDMMRDIQRAENH